MFKYTLQAVLDHRQRFEEQVQVELAELRRALAEDKRRLERIIDEERKNLFDLQKARDVARPVSIIAALIARGEELRKNFRNQQEAIERASAELEECRNRLVEAMREKEMLERLKEKQKKAYIQDRKRRELKVSDEAGRLRFGNRKHP